MLASRVKEPGWLPRRPSPVGRAAAVLVSSVVVGHVVSLPLSAAGLSLTGGWTAAMMLSSVVGFGLPGVLSRRHAVGVLPADRKMGIDLPTCLFVAVLAVVCQPLVEWAGYIDQAAYAKLWPGVEPLSRQTAEIIASICTFDGVWDWVAAIASMALVPALCEEVCFRGALLPLLRRKTGSWHAAVIVSAAVFSLAHMDLTAFLARTVLGVVLGVTFVATKSLLAPVLLHFCNNLMVVIALSQSADKVKDLTAPAELPELPVTILSLVLTIFEIYLIAKTTQIKQILARKG